MAYSHGSGSPGPLDRKIPSGFNFKTSLKSVSAGTTIKSAPREASILKIFFLIPKSYATTLNCVSEMCLCPSPKDHSPSLKAYCFFVETTFARSMPDNPGKVSNILKSS